MYIVDVCFLLSSCVYIYIYICACGLWSDLIMVIAMPVDETPLVGSIVREHLHRGSSISRPRTGYISLCLRIQ